MTFRSLRKLRRESLGGTVPAFSAQAAPAGVAGVPYSYAFVASGAPNFTVGSGTLPAGLSLSTGGVLSGTPLTNATSIFTVLATNGFGSTPSISQSVTITAPVPVFSAQSAPAGTVGTPYSYAFAASGAPTFSLKSGALPSGLTLGSNGVLSGTPTTANPFTFTVTATNGSGATDSTLQSVTISVAAPVFINQAAPAGVVSAAYSYVFTASGAPTFTLNSGTLPAGLTLASNGTLSGSPTTANTYVFDVKATNGTGNAVSVSQSVTVTTSAIAPAFSMTKGPSGIGPLAVFFDATATAAPSLTSLPFHELEYSWDFGDPAGSPVSGTTWAYGSGAGVNLRNAQRGPIVGHCFENVGTFTVTLTVKYGAITATTSQTVTVVDPAVAYAGGTSAVTLTASATTVNWAAHGFKPGQPVSFVANGGTLPANVTSGVPLYVIAAGLSTNSFEVSATQGGSAITFSGGAGAITGTYYRTICYSATGAMTGAPAGAMSVTASTQEAILTMMAATSGLAGAPGYRHLYNKGETFSFSSVSSVIAYFLAPTGPMTIGAYGSGANPIVQAAASGAGGALFMMGGVRSGSGGNPADDVRIMDVTFKTLETQPAILGVATQGQITNLLVLRCVNSGVKIGWSVNIGSLDSNNAASDPTKHGHTLPYWGLAIVDCQIANMVEGQVNQAGTYPYGAYIEAEKFWIAGCNFDLNSNSGREMSHGIRVPYAWKYALINNYVARSGNFQNSFKLHAPSLAASKPMTTTISVASPAVVGQVAHNATLNDPFVLTSGTLPAPLAFGTIYYVQSIVDADHFKISLTPGGAAINTTGSSSGILAGNYAGLNGNSNPIGWKQSVSGPFGNAGNPGPFGLGGGASQYGYIADNAGQAAWGTEWLAVESQQDNDLGSPVDFIVERNWAKPCVGGAEQFPIMCEGTRVTMRNNLLDVTGSNYHTGIYMGRAPGHTSPGITATNCWAYNNTTRNGDATANTVAVVVDATAVAVVAENNLAYSPSDAAAVMFSGLIASPATPAGGGLTSSNNSSNAQVRATDPLFVGDTSTPANWKITNAASYTKNAGADVPVWSDFFGTARAAGSMDIGASEQ